MATTATLDLVVNLKDEASKGLDGIAKKTSFLGDALKFATGTAILGGVTKLASGITSVGKAMIDSNAEFETYETQFGVLLKSVDKAKDRLKDLAKFGARTPFELPELVRADKVLTAFGLHTEETVKNFGISGDEILQVIGDVASGTGTSFEELSVDFGKFASGATGEAISRFQELGIATREQMADWGLQFSKSGQLLTPVKEAFTVLEQHVKEKFGGMMDAQSATFSGMLSNLQDWIGQTLRLVGQPIFEVVKSSLSDLLTFLNSPETQAAIQGFAEMLATGIGKAVTWIEQTAVPALKVAFIEIKETIKAMQTGDFTGLRIDLVTLFGPDLGLGIVDTLQKIREGWGLAKDSLQTFKDALAGDWKDSDKILPLHRAVGDLGLAFVDLKKTVVDDVFPAIQASVSASVPFIQQDLEDLRQFLMQRFFPQIHDGEVGLSGDMRETRDTAKNANAEMVTSFQTTMAEIRKACDEAQARLDAWAAWFMKHLAPTINTAFQSTSDTAQTVFVVQIPAFFNSFKNDVLLVIEQVNHLGTTFDTLKNTISLDVANIESVVGTAMGHIAKIISDVVNAINDLYARLMATRNLAGSIHVPGAPGGGGGSGFGDGGGTGGGGGGTPPTPPPSGMHPHEAPPPAGHTINIYNPQDGDDVIRGLRSVGLA